jgi:hypothetical protein
MNGYGTLRRVYVRPPVRRDLTAWADYGWHRPPDAGAADREHGRLRDLLAAAGAEVIAEPTRTPWNSLNARLRAPAGLQLTLFQELG